MMIGILLTLILFNIQPWRNVFYQRSVFCLQQMEATIKQMLYDKSIARDGQPGAADMCLCPPGWGARAQL